MRYHWLTEGPVTAILIQMSKQANIIENFFDWRSNLILHVITLQTVCSGRYESMQISIHTRGTYQWNASVCLQVSACNLSESLTTLYSGRS